VTNIEPMFESAYAWLASYARVDGTEANFDGPPSAWYRVSPCTADSCGDCHFNDVCENVGCKWDDTVPANGEVAWCTAVSLSPPPNITTNVTSPSASNTTNVTSPSTSNTTNVTSPSASNTTNVTSPSASNTTNVTSPPPPNAPAPAPSPPPPNRLIFGGDYESSATRYSVVTALVVSIIIQVQSFSGTCE